MPETVYVSVAGPGWGGRGDLDTTLSAIYNLCLEENASVGMFSSS